MTGAIFGDIRVANIDYLQMQIRACRINDPGVVFRFSNKSTQYILPLSDSHVGNNFHPLPRRLFDWIIVCKGMPLYRSTMTRDWLSRLLNALKTGGILHMEKNCLGEGPGILMSWTELSTLHPTLRNNHKNFLSITREEDKWEEEGNSVLAAYWQRSGTLILDHIFGGSIWQGDEAHLDVIFGSLFPDAGSGSLARRRPSRNKLVDIVQRVRAGELSSDNPCQEDILVQDTSWEFRENAVQVQNAINGWLRYRLWGAYYKCALYGAVMRDLLKTSPSRSMIDHGGNVGLIALQLLHEKDLNITDTINADIASNVLIPGQTLLDAMESGIRDRIKFFIGSAEEFEYRQEYDVVAFTHCLLYLRRDLLVNTIGAAYDALKPGGLLLLLENTLPPTSKGGSDEDIIFSPDELDAVLTGMGEIHYFLTKTGLETDRDGSRKSAVLRLIMKI